MLLEARLELIGRECRFVGLGGQGIAPPGRKSASVGCFPTLRRPPRVPHRRAARRHLHSPTFSPRTGTSQAGSLDSTRPRPPERSKEVIERMSKIRRVIVGTLAASALVVGALGVGNAWAASGSGSGRTSSSHGGSTSSNCPHHDAGGSDSSSGTTSLSL